MNQKFKLKYDELRESNPTDRSDEKQPIKQQGENQFYQHPGNMRCICFAWPNGNKNSFNYIDLVSKKLDVTGEINSLTLYFRSDVIVLKGYNLDILLMYLDNQTIYLISQVDQRYLEAYNGNDASVIEIELQNNNN